MDDFAAIILTHGRPDRVYTYKTLRSYGYSGRVVLLVDDQDSTLNAYRARYGGEVEVFSKAEIGREFDLADNFNGDGAVVFARNASFHVAQRLGLRFFVQLDDDYTYFSYRFDARGCYAQKMCHRLDEVFPLFVAYLTRTPFVTVAMGQGGDYISGGAGLEVIGSKRKAMNVFVCETARPFQFSGRLNEDVNTYTEAQRRGVPMLTVLGISVYQGMTQKNAGGMTDLYLDAGTYVKTFYTVMFAPSAVKVAQIAGYKNGVSHPRIHHRINWNAVAPCIIREQHRKAS